MTSESDDGGPVFPQYVRDEDTAMAVGGITIRDYFATKIMAQLISEKPNDQSVFYDIASRAYKAADSMLEARKR